MRGKLLIMSARLAPGRGCEHFVAAQTDPAARLAGCCTLYQRVVTATSCSRTAACWVPHSKDWYAHQDYNLGLMTQV